LQRQNNIAQGTIEYLIIIGIVVVLSLVVVGLVLSQTGSGTED
jgi:preprotein translocase subunit SecG